jgi:gluconolactonase
VRALALLLLLPACAAEQPAPSDGGMPDDLSAADLAATDLAGAASDLQPYPDPLAGTGAATQAPGSGTYQFTEGPVWLSRGVLLFSDIPANRIYEYDPLAQMVVPFRDPSGNANGLAIDGAGRLYACEGGQRRVTRTDGAVTPIASTFNGQPFNQPNDVIVRSDGTVYFTDPNYTGQPGSQPKERVYRLTGAATPAAALTVVDDTLARPNGIALSPDERTLYVADEPAARVYQYPVAGDGTVGARADFAATANSPDGMAVDDAGNVYVATQAGVEVRRPDGTLRGTVPVPEQPANCTFGGADRRTLYITARKGLYQVRLNVPGLP